MPLLQKMVGLFFSAIILHVWEETRWPGGFTEMITKKLNFTHQNPHFGEFITGTYVILIVFVPLFFPSVVFLSLAAILLGVLEAIAHTVAIKMFDGRKYYSPGLVTAVFILLPISIYTIVYAVENNLVPPSNWIYAILYMLGSLMLAQQIVVRTSSMKYSEFLKNVKKALFTKTK